MFVEGNMDFLTEVSKLHAIEKKNFLMGKFHLVS